MIYEVVTGHVLLSKRIEFERLHREILLPAYAFCGIKIVQCLMCEVGTIGKFIDVYEYESYGDYDYKTSQLEQLLHTNKYYPKIQECIKDSISVELMHAFNKIAL